MNDRQAWVLQQLKQPLTGVLAQGPSSIPDKDTQACWRLWGSCALADAVNTVGLP